MDTRPGSKGWRHLEQVVRQQSSRDEIKATFVIATRNSAARTDVVLSELAHYVANRDWSAEIVVVDDGSTDDTAQRAASLATRFDTLHVLRHGSQRGIGEAMRTGTQVARGAYVFLADIEEALPLESVARMLDKLRRGAGVVVASPALDSHLLDRLGDTAFRTLASLLVPIDKADIRGTFRAFRRDGVKEIAKRSRIKSRSWGVEWLALARKMKLSIEEILVSTGANSTAVPRSHVREPRGDVIRDLLRIRRNFGSKAYARPRKDHAGLFDTSFVQIDREELARVRSAARRAG